MANRWLTKGYPKLKQMARQWFTIYYPNRSVFDRIILTGDLRLIIPEFTYKFLVENTMRNHGLHSMRNIQTIRRKGFSLKIFHRKFAWSPSVTCKTAQWPSDERLVRRKCIDCHLAADSCWRRPTIFGRFNKKSGWHRPVDDRWTNAGQFLEPLQRSNYFGSFYRFWLTHYWFGLVYFESWRIIKNHEKS